MRWLVVLTVLSVFASEIVTAEVYNSRELLATAPEGPIVMKREHVHWVVQYCPDNTCDLLEISTLVNESDVRRLALGFFVYFSSYAYLRKWQEDVHENEAIQVEIQYLISKECPIQNAKELVECRLRELSNTQKVAIFFVRFDEGNKVVTRLQLDDILK